MVVYYGSPKMEAAWMHMNADCDLLTGENNQSQYRIAAILSYLGTLVVPFFAPLAVYWLVKESSFVRKHAIQSLNMTVTLSLYVTCLTILSLGFLGTPFGAALFLGIYFGLYALIVGCFLFYLVRAIISASRGTFLAVPRWICVGLF